MRLRNVRPGDVVRAGALHAIVIRRERREIVVRGICNGSVRRLRADEIEAHWRQAAVRVEAKA
jgi:hypothetical protein